MTLLVVDYREKKKKFTSPIALLGTNTFASLEIPGCFFYEFQAVQTMCARARRKVPDFVEKCSRSACLPSDFPIPETKSLPYVPKICSNWRLEKFGNEIYKFRPLCERRRDQFRDLSAHSFWNESIREGGAIALGEPRARVYGLVNKGT